MSVSDPYDILELEKPTNLKDLDKAYRRLCRKYHPDHGGDATKFKELEQAYKTIHDELTGKDPKMETFLKNVFSQITPEVDIHHFISTCIKMDRIKAERLIKEKKAGISMLKHRSYKKLTPTFAELARQNDESLIEQYEFQIEQLKEDLKMMKKVESFCLTEDTNRTEAQIIFDRMMYHAKLVD